MDFFKEIFEVHKRISPYINKTAVLHSSLLNEISGCQVFFKCENFQKMGAFKMRGATNAILQIAESDRPKGVVTHSSGNMAQAVALSARQLGIPAYIVMPDNAPSVKKNAVIQYGGKVTEVEATIEARQKAADEIVAQTGASFLHPSNDIHVILGQGTAALELLEVQPDLDFIFVPVGGGGLLAGTCIAVEAKSDHCKVIAGEPMEADDAFRSLASGRIELNDTANTIADGLRTQLGDVNFPIIQKYTDSIVRVSEEEIINAMRLIWERMKIIVEPSSAVAFAAVLKAKEKLVGKKIGVIVSGGNVDLSRLPF